MSTRIETALFDEITRLSTIPNIETKARSIRRALVLLESGFDEVREMRDHFIKELHADYGWTYEQIGTYFKLSRQRAHEIGMST